MNPKPDHEMKTLTPDQQFFYNQAGYSYDPKTQTKEEGKRECAIALAEAEFIAKARNVRFEWRKDDITSEDFSDEKPFYRLWYCIARFNGDVISSLGGIDFGRNKSPFGEPYKRVVEAELCLEFASEAKESLRCACGDIETVND